MEVVGDRMVQAASKVVTMLPSTPQVEAVYLDSQSGILAGLADLPPTTTPLHPEPSSSSVAQTISKKIVSPFTNASSSSSETTLQESSEYHTLLIDQTTLDPTAAKMISKTISDSTAGRAVMLDAPVSGGGLFI